MAKQVLLSEHPMMTMNSPIYTSSRAGATLAGLMSAACLPTPSVTDAVMHAV